MNPFSLLSEILGELRRIRILMEGGRNGLPLPPLGDIDESAVLYTEDWRTVEREKEEETFWRLHGRFPHSGESLPGPLDPEGREWPSIPLGEEEEERLASLPRGEAVGGEGS